MSQKDCTKRWASGIVVLILLLIAASSGMGAESAPVKQLNVLGTSAIHKKNLADGRKNAINDALAAAVGHVVMEMLTDETVVRRFQLINDNILNQRDTYIRNYRVLTESISGSTIRTLVQVDVVTDRLSRDLSKLGLALSGAVNPRLAFMVAEKTAAGDNYIFWWGTQPRKGRTICEAAMASTLQEVGFEIIPSPELNQPLNLAMTISQSDILALGNQLGADIIVFGTAMAASAANTMGGTIQAFQADVNVQAFDVQSGVSMGQTRKKSVASAQEASLGERQALTDVGALAGNDLARQIMAAWQQTQEGSTTIDVVVDGTSGQIASFVKLRTAISSLSGVKELKMAEMATDHARLSVNYQGTALSLADALLLKTFSGFGIDIYDVSPQSIRIRLINN